MSLTADLLQEFKTPRMLELKTHFVTKIRAISSSDSELVFDPMSSLSHSQRYGLGLKPQYFPEFFTLLPLGIYIKTS